MGIHPFFIKDVDREQEEWQAGVSKFCFHSISIYV